MYKLADVDYVPIQATDNPLKKRRIQNETCFADADRPILLVEILYRIANMISIVFSEAKWIVPLIENLKSAGVHLILCYKEGFTNLSPETREKRGKKNEDKINRIDKTSESVINRMVGVNNNRN